MARSLKIGLPIILAAVLVPVVWSHLTSHDDLFDTQHLLQADAAALPTTCVSPHLQAPIETGRNVLWCGTFQLAWNEACALVGEDLHFAGNEPAIVPILNQKAFDKGDLDAASYVALADFVRNGVYGRIGRELHDKFGGHASPKALPSPADAPRPQDIVAYSYLFKNLKFAVPFERIEQPLVFDGCRVASFGISEEGKSSQRAMFPQVLVHDYQDADDFVIELQTKSSGDRVILAKTQPAKTLDETIAAVQHRAAGDNSPTAIWGDVLKVPKLNFDITRTYSELLGARLAIANPTVAKDLMVTSAVQNTRFQLDEKGVKLKSDAHISFGCGAVAKPRHPRRLIFDKPFLIVLQRSDAKAPYFALWIGNADLLQRLDGG